MCALAEGTFVVNLSNASNATITDNQASGTILSDDNDPPSISSAAAVSIEENQTAVIDVQSTDPDGETENGGGLSYSLSGGADQALFSIDAATGVLTFLAAPDFETPGDASEDNVYDVQVTVTDAGGLSGLQNIAVTVTDGEAPDPGDSTKVLNLTTFATFSAETNSRAIDLSHPKDGSGRVFISTNEGKILGYSSTGASLGTFLDLNAPGVLPDFDPALGFTTRGLSFIAFHPDYANVGAPGEGKLYTFYKSLEPGLRSPDYSAAALPTRPGNVLSQYAVTEWTVDSSNPNQIDTSTRREVIRFELSGQLEDSHSIGQLTFNPFAKPGDADYGNLYVPLGDMSCTGTVPNWQHVQDADNPFGKILRINPLVNASDTYSVPSSNPFHDGGSLLDNDGNTEEIAAWGFRNPQNMSFAKDSNGNGRLVVFDIGASDFEEVNIVDVGDNHGWTRFDGPVDGNLATTLNLPSVSTLEFPATGYDHNIPNVPGAAPTAGATGITGGFVVSDPLDPSFQNQLLFGDLARGAFFHADWNDLIAADAADNQAVMFVMNVSIDGSAPGAFPSLIGSSRGDARFGVDEGGRLFVVSRQTNTVFVTDLIANQSPVNEAPSISSAAAVDTAENQTAVIDVQSSDPDGETENGGGLSYGITGGADQALFSLDAATGVLTFTAAPDFEIPGDAGADNVYDVQVTVTDAGGLTGSQNIAVTVTDVNEAPAITSAATVNAAENQTAVLDVASSDPDGETENGGGLSYSLTGGADQALFSINAATGLLTFNAAPDFETPGDAGGDNVYDVQVTVTDAAGLTGMQNIAVTVVADIQGSLDVDDNSDPDALTDGIIIVRYLFGLRGDSMISDAIGPAANRTDPAEIAAFLDQIKDTVLDVDDNGTPDALTDGIIIVRYLFGLRGDSMVRDAIGFGAQRTDPVEIAAFLDQFTVTSGALSSSETATAVAPTGTSETSVSKVSTKTFSEAGVQVLPQQIEPMTFLTSAAEVQTENSERTSSDELQSDPAPSKLGTDGPNTFDASFTEVVSPSPFERMALLSKNGRESFPQVSLLDQPAKDRRVDQADPAEIRPTPATSLLRPASNRLFQNTPFIEHRPLFDRSSGFQPLFPASTMPLAFSDRHSEERARQFVLNMNSTRVASAVLQSAYLEDLQDEFAETVARAVIGNSSESSLDVTVEDTPESDAELKWVPATEEMIPAKFDDEQQDAQPVLASLFESVDWLLGYEDLSWVSALSRHY